MLKFESFRVRVCMCECVYTCMYYVIIAELTRVSDRSVPNPRFDLSPTDDSCPGVS
jgi:hypothetical protein